MKETEQGRDGSDGFITATTTKQKSSRLVEAHEAHRIKIAPKRAHQCKNKTIKGGLDRATHVGFVGTGDGGR